MAVTVKPYTCEAWAKMSTMSTTTRWLMGLLMAGLFTGMVSIGIPLINSVASMETSIDTMTIELRKQGMAMTAIVQGDISNLKARMLVAEQRQILPRAEEQLKEQEVEIEKLEERIRVLELQK